MVIRRAMDTRPVVRRFTAVTGTGDAPGRSSRLLRSRRPCHLATAAPHRQAAEALYGSSSPTDPALPGGRTWGKFYVLKPQAHKGFPGISFTYFWFRRVLHRTTRAPPQTRAGSPQISPRPVESARRASARALRPGTKVEERPARTRAREGPSGASRNPVPAGRARDGPSRALRN